MLGDAARIDDLGEELTPGMFEREARYLFEVEWARSAEDILWRRTKCGLYAQPQHVARLQQWLQEQAITMPPATAAINVPERAVNAMQ
jgi:glycerol-3-phosphate dehydrogenase